MKSASILFDLGCLRKLVSPSYGVFFSFFFLKKEEIASNVSVRTF